MVTDSTEHNMGVIESVCEELGTDSTPDSLSCHIHPLMIFQKKLKQVCQKFIFDSPLQCHTPTAFLNYLDHFHIPL